MSIPMTWVETNLTKPIEEVVMEYIIESTTPQIGKSFNFNDKAQLLYREIHARIGKENGDKMINEHFAIFRMVVPEP